MRLRVRAGRRDVARELRDYARLQVRAGLLDEPTVLSEVAAAIRAELTVADASSLAGTWLADERAALRADAAGWPRPTDHDRLCAVVAALVALDVPVLQGVADHWVVDAELERRAATGGRPRGIVWFTAPDVWHAIDHGMLEVNLWHGDTANAAPGDDLLGDVLAEFARQGLRATFDEGRIEVAAHWRRVPA